jgi:hypothetical protein
VNGHPRRALRVLQMLVPLALVVALVGTTPALAATPSTNVPSPSIPSDLPAEIDPLATYQGQGICDLEPKEGTDKLIALIQETYPGFADAIYSSRECAYGNRSEHKEYRAIDWMIDESKSSQFKVAQSFIRWLLAKDSDGNKYAMARRLGIMYIGWNDRIWQSAPGEPEWSELNWLSCFVNQADDYDTSCHRDHIHLSLSWDGAAGLTSFWGGDPTPLPFCVDSGTMATPKVTVRGLDFVSVRPTRVFDSANPVAPADPNTACRLTQPANPVLTAENQIAAGVTGVPVYVDVTGVGPTDPLTVRAVAVRVTAEQSNAPVSVYAWPSGGAPPRDPILKAALGVSNSAETVLPVGSDGTVALGVNSGASVVSVDVLGYFVRRLPDATSASGSITPILPTLAYTTKGSVRGALKPGESRTVSLAGRGGLPENGGDITMSSVWLTVTTSGARSSGTVILARPHAGIQDASARASVRRLQDVSSAVLTGVDELGRVTLTNRTRMPVNVDVSATGWSARAGGPGDLLLPIDAETTLDTASGAGVVSVERSKPAGMKIVGVGSIPKSYVGGVIARVSLTGGAAATSLSMWPVSRGLAIQPTLSAAAGETRTGLVLLPVSRAGGTRWLTSQPDAQVTVRVIGVLRSLPAVVVPRAAVQP